VEHDEQTANEPTDEQKADGPRADTNDTQKAALCGRLRLLVSRGTRRKTADEQSRPRRDEQNTETSKRPTKKTDDARADETTKKSRRDE
jgi:chromatin remodeling complex protein RSC6